MPDPVGRRCYTNRMTIEPPAGAGSRGARGVGEAELVARLRAAGCVFAEDEARLLLTEAPAGRLVEWADRRVAGEPLEHVLGWALFDGLRVAVGPGVFVPRRRSELLVRQAVAALRPRDGRTSGIRAGDEPDEPAAADEAAPVVVELCCGAAAIATAIGHRVPGVVLHAADVDPAAVACARRNLAASGGTAWLGDLDAPLPAHLRGRVDVLVANAPYVPSAEVPFMPTEARDHEPLRALDGGPDGVDVQRRVVAAAPGWLAPDGVLVVETGRRQAPVTAAAFRAAGLTARVVRSERLDATVVVGRRDRRRDQHSPAQPPRDTVVRVRPTSGRFRSHGEALG